MIYFLYTPKQLYFVNFYSTFSRRTRSADFVKVAADTAGGLRRHASRKCKCKISTKSC